MKKIDPIIQVDVIDLAGYVCGLGDENIEIDYIDAIENALAEQFDVDMATFTRIVARLLPLCLNAPGAITHEPFIGFAAEGVWLLKRGVKREQN